MAHLDGPDAAGLIEASLARAEELVEWSGARAFGPCILEERARLREVLGDADGAEKLLRSAHTSFGEVEATGHVERLARELSDGVGP